MCCTVVRIQEKIGGFRYGSGFELFLADHNPTQKDHLIITLLTYIGCVGFESGFRFKAVGSGFGFKKIKMDSDWCGFGFAGQMDSDSGCLDSLITGDVSLSDIN